jgi:hypothetical protein
MFILRVTISHVFESNLERINGTNTIRTRHEIYAKRNNCDVFVRLRPLTHVTIVTMVTKTAWGFPIQSLPFG